MSAVVYKYGLLPGVNEIGVPEGSQVLEVATQDENMCLWMWQPATSNTFVLRKFAVHATGETFNDDGYEPVGSCVDVGGWMVFHVFEVCGR